MFVKQLDKNTFKFSQRYKDKYTDKWRTASVTLDRDTSQSRNKAQKLIDEKIKKSTDLPKTEITFKECYERWTATYFLGVKVGTKKSYEGAIKKIETNFNMNSKINKIDSVLLERFFLNKNIIDSSNSVMITLKKVFNGTFRYAIKNRFIKNNPMKNVSIPKKQKTLEELNKQNQKYLEIKEIEKVLESFSNKEWINKNVTKFILHTGLRISELQGIRYDDISNNILSIQRNFDRFSSLEKPKFTTPKTINSYRDIVLSKRALEIVNEMKEKNIFKSEHVFYSSEGNIFNSDSFRKSLKKIESEVNLKKNLSPHILRHTHISILAEKGIPIKAIMERVGHADERITLSIYTHVTEKAKSNLENMLNEISF